MNKRKTLLRGCDAPTRREHDEKESDEKIQDRENGEREREREKEKDAREWTVLHFARQERI